MLSKRWPLLGHALEFAKDRSLLFKRGHAAHGKIFSIQLANKTAVVLGGSEFSTWFFKETDKALNMSKPYGFLKAILGNVAFVAGHEAYMNQRPVLYAPFQREKMTGYLQVIDTTAHEWVHSLGESGKLELTEAINKLVMEIAGRAIMGTDFMQKAGKDFWNDSQIVCKALDPLLPHNWPLPKFIRRDRARKRMIETLTPILAERRNHPERFSDFLQDFINTRQQDGTAATDEELLGLIIALCFAGHETTAGQASWTIIQLLQHPAYLAKVEAEIQANFPQGAHVNARTLSSLKHVKWAIDETTRLKPSADITIRVTDEDIEVGGFLIPEGTAVFNSTDVSHLLEDVFPHAQLYDPERFSAERSEHKEHKNAIIGFGGGLHKCPGMNFALNEMLAITALLFQNYDVELLTPDPQIRRDMGANRPAETWIAYKRKPVVEAVSPDVMQAAVAAGCPHMLKAMAAREAAVPEQVS
jgi:sterol 14alpha-demethylase